MERGTHRELIARGGLYARLYHEQFEAEAAQLAELAADVPPIEADPAPVPTAARNA